MPAIGTTLAIVMVMVAGCRDTAADRPEVDNDNPIEIAARDANLVLDAGATPLTGLFERRHVAGSDSLCFIPDGGSGRYRFALIARFGETLTCEGRGTARHEDDRIALDFGKGGCAFTASYDGNAVRVPGSVPDGCSAYCGPRASMSGVTVERIGWTREDARRQCDRAQD